MGATSTCWGISSIPRMRRCGASSRRNARIGCGAFARLPSGSPRSALPIDPEPLRRPRANSRPQRRPPARRRRAAGCRPRASDRMKRSTVSRTRRSGVRAAGRRPPGGGRRRSSRGRRHRIAGASRALPERDRSHPAAGGRRAERARGRGTAITMRATEARYRALAARHRACAVSGGSDFHGDAGRRAARARKRHAAARRVRGARGNAARERDPSFSSTAVVKNYAASAAAARSRRWRSQSGERVAIGGMDARGCRGAREPRNRRGAARRGHRADVRTPPRPTSPTATSGWLPSNGSASSARARCCSRGRRCSRTWRCRSRCRSIPYRETSSDAVCSAGRGVRTRRLSCSTEPAGEAPAGRARADCIWPAPWRLAPQLLLIEHPTADVAEAERARASRAWLPLRRRRRGVGADGILTDGRGVCRERWRTGRSPCTARPARWSRGSGEAGGSKRTPNCNARLKETLDRAFR